MSLRKKISHNITASDYEGRSSMDDDVKQLENNVPFITNERRSKNNSFEDVILKLPVSDKGMELAKRTIIEQAATIKKLEAQLELVIEEKGNNWEGSINTAQQPTPSTENETKKDMIKSLSQPNRKLSAEERLKAHRERKLQENKYKEEVGKWGEPPPLECHDITKKVKEKSDLVHRLVASPIDRKRHDEIKKTVKRTTQRYSNTASDDQIPERNDLETCSNEILNSNKRYSLTKKTNSMSVSEKKRNDLMNRLAMSTKQRREENSHDVPENVKRALRGHVMEKKQWNMTNEYNMNNEPSSFENDDRLKLDQSHLLGNKIDTKISIQCATCCSQEDCEKDEDNPGTYYCKSCWEEYETSITTENTRSTKVWNRESVTSTIGSPIATESIASFDKIQDANALWFVHDNPKLGNNFVCSSENKMKCLLETKDPHEKNCVRILIGIIEYSGRVASLSSQSHNKPIDVKRGTECIKLTNIIGFKINLEKIETRIGKGESILEYKLDPQKGLILSGRKAEMSLEIFFDECKGAVDVILDPQVAPGHWYPFKELRSNRKIAPQFKSKGVGYIRLGDDMGRNGLAFLSTNSCKTFFRPIDTDQKMTKTLSSLESLKSTSKSAVVGESESSKKYTFRSRKGSHLAKEEFNDDADDKRNMPQSFFEDDSFSSFTSQGENDIDSTRNTMDVIKQLNQSETGTSMKWQEKVDLLNILEKKMQKSTDRIICSNSLKVVQNILSSKNVNIHIQRSAINVMIKAGRILKKELISEISWKTIMIESLKLLKNKRISSSAKKMLHVLHGRCYTLIDCLQIISHVLEIGKSTRSSARLSMAGSSKTRNSRSFESNKAKPNNVEIIEWLAIRTEAERFMNISHSALDKNGLSLLSQIFVTYDSHRDARCRKNALDGLMHTVLYAMNKAGMKLAEAMDMCSDLKYSNNRAWGALIQSIDKILKNEEHNTIHTNGDALLT